MVAMSGGFGRWGAAALLPFSLVSCGEENWGQCNEREKDLTSSIETAETEYSGLFRGFFAEGFGSEFACSHMGEHFELNMLTTRDYCEGGGGEDGCEGKAIRAWLNSTAELIIEDEDPVVLSGTVEVVPCEGEPSYGLNLNGGGTTPGSNQHIHQETLWADGTWNWGENTEAESTDCEMVIEQHDPSPEGDGGI